MELSFFEKCTTTTESIRKASAMLIVQKFEMLMDGRVSTISVCYHASKKFPDGRVGLAVLVFITVAILNLMEISLTEQYGGFSTLQSDC